MIQSFFVKFGNVNSTLISKQCICIPGFVFNQLTASWTDVTLLHSTTVFWQPLHWWPTYVLGNVFFNHRTIRSRTCKKKATHIPVSILKISRLNKHNLGTNWVETAMDVLTTVRFAGSACWHFPVSISNIKHAHDDITKLNRVNSHFVSVLHNRISCDCHAFTILSGRGDRCPRIAVQLVCKQIRAGSTYLHKCSLCASNIALNPTNTC